RDRPAERRGSGEFVVDVDRIEIAAQPGKVDNVRFGDGSAKRFPLLPHLHVIEKKMKGCKRHGRSSLHQFPRIPTAQSLLNTEGSLQVPRTGQSLASSVASARSYWLDRRASAAALLEIRNSFPFIARSGYTRNDDSPYPHTGSLYHMNAATRR